MPHAIGDVSIQRSAEASRQLKDNLGLEQRSGRETLRAHLGHLAQAIRLANQSLAARGPGTEPSLAAAPRPLRGEPQLAPLGQLHMTPQFLNYPFSILPPCCYYAKSVTIYVKAEGYASKLTRTVLPVGGNGP